jgi:hypothetical protein
MVHIIIPDISYKEILLLHQFKMLHRMLEKLRSLIKDFAKIENVYLRPHLDHNRVMVF